MLPAKINSRIGKSKTQIQTTALLAMISFLDWYVRNVVDLGLRDRLAIFLVYATASWTDKVEVYDLVFATFAFVFRRLNDISHSEFVSDAFLVTFAAITKRRHSRSLRVPAWKTVIVLGAAGAENMSVDDLHVSKSNIAAALTRNWVAWLLTVCLANRVKIALELLSAEFLSPNPKQRPTHLITSSSCLVFG